MDKRKPASAHELLQRQPPFDLEAEMAVIGSMLLDKDAVFESTVLSPNDFYDDANRIIFQMMMMMHETDQRVDDALTLVRNLKDAGDFEKVGGAAYIARFANAVPSVVHLGEYIEIVSECSRRRNVIAACTDALSRAYDNESAVETVELLQTKIENIGIDKTDHTITLQEDGRHRIELSKQIADGLAENDAALLTTGIKHIDNNYGGIAAPQNIVIAARPSDGKSAFAKQIANHVNQSHGLAVLYVTLEMDSYEVAERIWSERLKVNGNYIKHDALEDTERDALRDAAEEESAANFHISAPVDSEATWRRIAANATMMHATKGIGLFVLDYIQLIEHGDEKSFEAYKRASRGVKALARKLRIPVLTLAQLNREADKGTRRVPRLSDIRDCGDIEQDADSVLFLHRIEERKMDFSLVVAKWRNGLQNSFKMRLDGKHTRFVCVDDDGSDVDF